MSTVLSKVNVFKIKAVFTIPNKEVRIYYVGVISTINNLLEKPLLVELMFPITKKNVKHNQIVFYYFLLSEVLSRTVPLLLVNTDL